MPPAHGRGSQAEPFRARPRSAMSQLSGCSGMSSRQRELAESYETPSSPSSPGAECHACGAALTLVEENVPQLVVRATVPQPIAAALRRTHLLSTRERAVFELLGAGYDNRSIARDLGVSDHTVKRHVTVVLAKLGLESRLQAGLAALLSTSSWPASTT